MRLMKEFADGAHVLTVLQRSSSGALAFQQCRVHLSKQVPEQMARTILANEIARIRQKLRGFLSDHAKASA